MTPEWIAILLTGVAMVIGATTVWIQLVVKANVTKIATQVEAHAGQLATLENEQTAQWGELRTQGERIAHIEGKEWKPRSR